MNNRLDNALRLENSLLYKSKNISKTVFLYIIKCNEFYKIGYASNVKQRFNGYIVHNPYQCILLKTIELKNKTKAFNIERKIIKEYLSFHVKGEWLSLNEKQVENILNKYYV